MQSGKLVLSALILAAMGAAGFALGQTSAMVGTTVNDPIGPAPDPSLVPMTLPKDIKCTGTVGVQQMCYIYGDPDKPGPYTVIYKWYPGHFSKPHFHNNERWAYVISGTWWVSTSKVYDERTTYPVHAGSVAIDKINAIHWDGARTGEKEPAVLILSGTGPNSTIPVDETGKPLPAK